MGKRPEDLLWLRLSGMFRKVKGLKTQRLESGLTGLGIPDLLYSYKGIRGMIELKYLPDFPKRPQTTIKIPKFTNEQRIWLHTHGNAGDRCFFFIQIGAEFYLFNHHSAFTLGGLTKSQMRSECVRFWEKTINIDQLLESLWQKQN